MSAVIAIVVACDYELAPLKMQMSHVTTREIGGKVYYCGKLDAKEVIVVQGGVGRTNAASTTAVLCLVFKPRLIINSGTAGGLYHNLRIGDVVVANRLVYGDVDNCCFGLKFGQVPFDSEGFDTSKALLDHFQVVCQQVMDRLGDQNAPDQNAPDQNVPVQHVGEARSQIHRGLIVTVESFCESHERKQIFLKHWPEAMAVEMEGCAVAHVCHQFRVPCLIVRSISDTADDHVDYTSFASLAGQRSAQTTRAFIKHIDSNTST